MADPITIGELADVPVPESEISAQYHQEVANRIVHRFASANEMAASNLGDGSMATAAGRPYHRVAGVWREMLYGANAHTSYGPLTPGIAQDNNPADGYYSRQGYMVDSYARITVGNAPRFGADGATYVSVPFAAIDTKGLAIVRYWDLSGFPYTGHAYFSSGTQVRLYAMSNTNGGPAFLTDSVPFTWVVGNVIEVWTRYRAASLFS